MAMTKLSSSTQFTSYQFTIEMTSEEQQYRNLLLQEKYCIMHYRLRRQTTQIIHLINLLIVTVVIRRGGATYCNGRRHLLEQGCLLTRCLLQRGPDTYWKDTKSNHDELFFKCSAFSYLPHLSQHIIKRSSLFYTFSKLLCLGI